MLLYFLNIFADTAITVHGSYRPYVIKIINNDPSKQDITQIAENDLVQSLKFTTHGQDDFVVVIDSNFNVEIRDGKTQEKVLYRKSFQDYGNKRRLGHEIANYVFSQILGIPGHFLSKIAYVVETAPGQRKSYYMMGRRLHYKTLPSTRIMICDYDGENAVPVVSSKTQIMGLEWSPCGRYLLYRTIQNQKGQTAYMYDVQSRKNVDLSKYSNNIFGRNISTLAFGKDANEILLARSNKGTTSIYSYCLNSKNIAPLAGFEKFYIQTCPTYSPHGHLTFSSDRSGSETVYANIDGTVARLPIPRYYSFSQPIWRKVTTLKYRIFFSGRGKGYSSIWYADVSSSENPLQLGESAFKTIMSLRAPAFIENPSPSPNGAYLVFSQSVGKRKLYMMDERGQEIRNMQGRGLLDHLGSVVEAKWSA